MKRLLTLLLLLSSYAVAQNATVIDLSLAKANKAWYLYQAKQRADAAWDDYYAEIKAEYGGQLGGDPVFSKDFNHLVPKYEWNDGTIHSYYNGWGCGCWGCGCTGCITLTSGTTIIPATNVGLRAATGTTTAPLLIGGDATTSGFVIADGFATGDSDDLVCESGNDICVHPRQDWHRPVNNGSVN